MKNAPKKKGQALRKNIKRGLVIAFSSLFPILGKAESLPKENANASIVKNFFLVLGKNDFGLERKKTAFRLLEKIGYKWKTKDIAPLFDFLDTLPDDEIKSFLPFVNSMTPKDSPEMARAIYKRYLRLFLEHSKKPATAAAIAIPFHELFSYHICLPDIPESKIMKDLAPSIESRPEILIHLTQADSEIPLSYSEYKMDSLKSPRERRDFLKKFWRLYLDCRDDTVLPSFCEGLLNGGDYEIRFRIPRWLFDELMEKASSSERLQKAVAAILTPYGIPETFREIQALFRKEGKNFEIRERVFHNALSSKTADLLKNGGPYPGLVYLYMLRDEYPGYAEFLREKAPYLERLVLGDAEDEEEFGNALELLAASESLEKNTLPEIFRKLLERYPKLPESWKATFMFELIKYQNYELDDKLERFLLEKLFSPSASAEKMAATIMLPHSKNQKIRKKTAEKLLDILKQYLQGIPENTPFRKVKIKTIPALLALKTLTGQDHGADLDAWRKAVEAMPENGVIGDR